MVALYQTVIPKANTSHVQKFETACEKSCLRKNSCSNKCAPGRELGRERAGECAHGNNPGASGSTPQCGLRSVSAAVPPRGPHSVILIARGFDHHRSGPMLGLRARVIKKPDP